MLEGKLCEALNELSRYLSEADEPHRRWRRLHFALKDYTAVSNTMLLCEIPPKHLAFCGTQTTRLPQTSLPLWRRPPQRVGESSSGESSRNAGIANLIGRTDAHRLLAPRSSVTPVCGR